jgi:hypothetical protein
LRNNAHQAINSVTAKGNKIEIFETKLPFVVLKYKNKQLTRDFLTQPRKVVKAHS